MITRSALMTSYSIFQYQYLQVTKIALGRILIDSHQMLGFLAVTILNF